MEVVYDSGAEVLITDEVDDPEEEDDEDEVVFADFEYKLTHPNPIAPPQFSEASPGQGVLHEASAEGLNAGNGDVPQ